MKLKTSYIGLFLVFSVLLNAFALPLIYLDFQLNQAYIAKELCINRDNPATDCKGKCYLKKQLKKNQDADPVSQSQSGKKLHLEVFQQALSVFNFAQSVVLYELVPVHRPLYFPPSPLYGIFHPPQA